MKSKQKDGIKAVNQEYIEYDQVNKKQTYNLAEGAAEEIFDNETEIKSSLKTRGEFNFLKLKIITSLLNFNMDNVKDVKGKTFEECDKYE